MFCIIIHDCVDTLWVKYVARRWGLYWCWRVGKLW